MPIPIPPRSPAPRQRCPLGTPNAQILPHSHHLHLHHLPVLINSHLPPSHRLGFEDKGGVGCVKHRLFSEKEKEPWSIISLNTYVTMVTMIRTGGA